MKNKTFTVWLTLLLGSLGLQRVYLVGRFDRWAWLILLPTAVGWYGVVRARTLGLDDLWSWILIPLGGFALAASALVAIRYGLMDAPAWNARFNPQAEPEDAAGQRRAALHSGTGKDRPFGTAHCGSRAGLSVPTGNPIRSGGRGRPRARGGRRVPGCRGIRPGEGWALRRLGAE